MNPQYKSTSKQGKKIKTLPNNVASYAYQCRTEMVAGPYYLQYFPPPSQTLASFACEARSLTCCDVVSRLCNQSYILLTSAKSWMVSLPCTLCHKRYYFP